MIPLLVILGILLVILLLPVGVKVRYDEDGTFAAIFIGPYRRQLYPAPPKANKPPKEKTAKEKNPKENKPAQSGGSILDFWPFVELLWSFLGAFRRKLLVKELTLRVSFGGEDAARTAIQYGSAQGVLASVYPRLRESFRIRRENVGLSCDFTTSKITVLLALHMRLRIVDLLHLGLHYGFRALRTYLGISKKRKSVCQGTDAEPTIKNKAVQ